jgi:cell division protein FtsB
MSRPAAVGSERAGSAPAGARDGIRITPRAAVLVAVLLVLLFALAVPVRTYLAQRSQLAHIQHEEQVLEQQNVALQRQIAHLNDPTYLERLARECLGMVKPGEIGFVVVPKGGVEPAAPGSGAPVPAQGTNPDC